MINRIKKHQEVYVRIERISDGKSFKYESKYRNKNEILREAKEKVAKQFGLTRGEYKITVWQYTDDSEMELHIHETEIKTWK